MTLTGCPLPSTLPATLHASDSVAALVAERVELLALLWQLLDGDAAYCANQRLLMVTRLLPELRTYDATTQLAALRATHGRDAVIKGLVREAYGIPVSTELAALARALDGLSSRWADMAQMLGQPLVAARAQMLGRAASLADRIDPARDMARLTGEHDPLVIRVLPSLFLPPPQNGRHSALVTDGDGGATAYLFFGYPLDADPAGFGISAPWLLGGAWHYAVARFMDRHWPAISAGLAARPALADALIAALAEHREAVKWPGCIAEHLVIALKCALCRQAGLPDTVHRDFARTQAAALFDWFVSQVAAMANDPARFVARFTALPELMEQDLAALLAAAATMRTGPAAINYALASRRERILVIPDDWDSTLAERIMKRWALVARDVQSESAVIARHEALNAAAHPSIIAFGEIGRGGLAERLIGARAAALIHSEEGGLHGHAGCSRRHQPY